MDRVKKLVTQNFKRIISKISTFSTILWSFFIGFLGLVLSEPIFSGENLLRVPFLGEVLIACTLFLLTYFFGAVLVQSISKAFENFVVKTLRTVLNEFWRVQYSRLLEAISRENNVASIQEAHVANDYSPPAIVLDTSTIIDGRILGVIQTGFLDAQLIVPQNVIDELQHMADKSDSLKRQKGRRGLDALKEMRKSMPKGVFAVIDLKSKPEEVDKSLVAYCRKHKAKIATVDYNLNKAAQISGVKVLNINRLANEIKTNLLPGEIMIVKLVQRGKEDGQAIAYLEDGTMLVVKNASEHVGLHKEVRVEKVLQTSAGRMVFAGLNDEIIMR